MPNTTTKLTISLIANILSHTINGNYEKQCVKIAVFDHNFYEKKATKFSPNSVHGGGLLSNKSASKQDFRVKT